MRILGSIGRLDLFFTTISFSFKRYFSDTSLPIFDETMRKLASIRRIGDIQPIPTADQIVCATVDGWKAVIKKDEFHVNEVIVYAEIDSWIPHEVAPFLSKGKKPRVYNDIKGERLRTVNLRGQISQGLILPLSLIKDKLIELQLLLTDESNLDTLLGYDVTELLGIQKYEPILYERYVPKTKDGKAIPPLGKPFPSFFPKTDQERIQNLAGNLNYYKTSAFTWEVTEKLDGCSVTFYYLAESDVFGVCSRNLDLYPLSEDTPTNSPARLYWGMAEQLNILNLFRSANRSIAIQGEIIGEKIQGNLYKLKNQKQFYVFDIYDIPTGKYFSPIERREFCEMFGLLHVPVLETHIVIPMEKTIDEMLKEAEGFSVISNKPNTEREGLVFKCNDRNSSFKCISNKFLLSHE